ncbi:Smr/MutS family protein [Jannaschia sp. Os4]|uniref:Smr/MutS family protein n=1 Tax=Jannaschia sp. Os4 TaxID=2807617 RepID=UPI00193980D1|nr:Smr/MutS family protein [Jannaschia sp. Os4]MBM2575539.1 Smr/MutS family protein [Jannaschia sp. Os4]
MSRRRGLTQADRDLWAAYAKTAKPLGDRPRNREMGAAPSPPTSTAIPRPPPIPAPQPKLRIGSRAPKRPPANDFAAPVEQEVSRQPLRMDAKRHRKMTAGKLAPEAKLDLHGMTLAQAQPRLTRFVMDGHAKGLRLLLVVTGKGKRRDEDGPIPTRHGVLRHQVPTWLGMAPLAPLVLQVRTAHRTQGGQGAYYVYLRR